MRAAALLLAAITLVGCARTEQAKEFPVVQLPVAADPTVSFSLSFRVGSQNDPPGKEGLAFLTGEMIADAATERNSLEAILEKLYPFAAGYDVRVDRELTTLTGRVHVDNVGAYLELFTDAFLRPAFLRSDFQRLRTDAINYLENELRYASDEELAKAALYDAAFAGTAYAHPTEGTVAGLRAITLDDVRRFYREHYTAANAVLGIGGGYAEATAATLRAAVANLPAGSRTRAPTIEPAPFEGREALLIAKPGADASLSLGFPIDVRRGDRDFYALWIANSWFGEHRSQTSHLFQVIREARGLNYGDYSYIEAFPHGGDYQMPPTNVPRRQQLFEIWIRTLPNEQAPFALRAALRELEKLVDEGMAREDFELTRTFLKKYAVHFAETTEERLGYAIDDVIYEIAPPGHLARFRQMMDELTLEDVNAAIRRHLQYERLLIAIVTGDWEGLAARLASDAPSPIVYATPKPESVLAEDREIERWPLKIDDERIRTIPVEQVFAD